MFAPSLATTLWAWMPELALSVGALLVFLLGVCFRRPGPVTVATWLILTLAGGSLWQSQSSLIGPAFFGLVTLDQWSLIFRWLALGVVSLVSLLVSSSPDVEASWRGEYLGLLLLIGVGLMLMAEAHHLLMAAVAIELVSLSSYALVALTRDARASEAALKYFLFGALSSGIMVFGMSWLYGLSGGALEFSQIQEAMGRLSEPRVGAAVVAFSLVLAGLAFKISMVPFHMWTPDVYEGAPIPVTAMLSVGPKAAGFALLLRLTAMVWPLWIAISPGLLILTLVTMTFGNVVALAQQNVKRLLAYSTIGQVGYLLIGYVVNTRHGIAALLIYLVAYLFMNLGAFACVVAVCHEAHDESVEAFRGLAGRSPALAFCLTIFLLSLAGLPPLAGFLGKFLLFGAAIEARWTILAVAGAINSAIALYYYVNIIRQMYLLPPTRRAALSLSWPLRVAVGICGTATVVLGLCPGALLDWIGRVAARNLL